MKTACCFCDLPIKNDDKSALRVSLANLRVSSGNGYEEDRFAHRRCVKLKLAPLLRHDEIDYSRFDHESVNDA